MSEDACPREIKLQLYWKENCRGEKEATGRRVRDHARFKTNEKELRNVEAEMEEQYMPGRGERCEETKVRRRREVAGRAYQGGA
jgi:hypothetical protein